MNKTVCVVIALSFYLAGCSNKKPETLKEVLANMVAKNTIYVVDAAQKEGKIKTNYFSKRKIYKKVYFCVLDKKEYLCQLEAWRGMAYLKLLLENEYDKLTAEEKVEFDKEFKELDKLGEELLENSRVAPTSEEGAWMDRMPSPENTEKFFGQVTKGYLVYTEPPEAFFWAKIVHPISTVD